MQHIVIIFQTNKGRLKRGQRFNGYAEIIFAKPERKGNVQGKFKQGFALGRCFLLSDNNIAEIRGKFENDGLNVRKLRIVHFVVYNARNCK